MGKMAVRWSKNTSYDFNIDQSLAQRCERFSPKLIYRPGTPIMWANSLTLDVGLQPDSSFFLHFSHLHGAGWI
jgi:hypothetical protein